MTGNSRKGAAVSYQCYLFLIWRAIPTMLLGGDWHTVAHFGQFK